MPGFIDTDMVGAAKPDFKAALELPAGGLDALIAQKQGRYGTPEEAAEAALFFASDRSGSCTRQRSYPRWRSRRLADLMISYLER